MGRGLSRKSRPVLAAGALVIMAGVLGGCAGADHRKGPSLAEAKAAYQRQDYWTAAQLLKPLAYQGNADAQYALGYMYYYGRGVEQNRSWAMSWFGEAVRLGHPKAGQALASLRSEARLTRRPTAAAARQADSAPVYHATAQAGARTGVLPARTPPVAASKGGAMAAKPAPESPAQGVRTHPQPAVVVPVSGAKSPVAAGQDDVSPPGPTESSARAPDAPKAKAQPASEPAVAADRPAPVKKPESRSTRQAGIAERPRFTLQLIGSRSKADLEAVVDRYGLDEVRYFESQLGGSPWYRLLYRGFDTLAEARRALKALPAGLNRHKPWVRNFPPVQLAALKRSD
jgi:septal ring-binding cell division protein DamX